MGSFHVSVERTLVVLQAVALCCLLLTAAVLRAVDAVQTGDGLPVAITWLALVPIITALWALRPRVVRAGHGVEWTMLAVLLATPVAVFGTLDFTIPVLLLVVAFAVVDVSLRAGVHATIWISCVGFALHVFGKLLHVVERVSRRCDTRIDQCRPRRRALVFWDRPRSLAAQFRETSAR